MKINTTESVADALGITPQRVGQIIKKLGIEPQRIRGAIILSDAQVRLIEKEKLNTNLGRPRKEKKK